MVAVTLAPFNLRSLFPLAPGTLEVFLLFVVICSGKRLPRPWGLLLLRSMYHCKKYMGAKPNFQPSQVSYTDLTSPFGQQGSQLREVFFHVMPDQLFPVALGTKPACLLLAEPF